MCLNKAIAFLPSHCTVHFGAGWGVNIYILFVVLLQCWMVYVQWDAFSLPKHSLGKFYSLFHHNKWSQSSLSHSSCMHQSKGFCGQDQSKTKPNCPSQSLVQCTTLILVFSLEDTLVTFIIGTRDCVAKRTVCTCKVFLVVFLLVAAPRLPCLDGPRASHRCGRIQ